jgi:methyltransferase (TIGR00027 family)
MARHDPRIASVAPPGAADTTAALLAAMSRSLALDQRWLASRGYRAVSNLALRRGPMRGAVLHLALRKRWIEDEVRVAIAEGFTQFVIVGAGYDTLAFRLAREDKEKRLVFFEVDVQPTQHEKRKALRLVGKKPKGLRWVVLDLERGALDRSIADQKRFDPRRKTLFIAEGILMYLDERDARYILRAAAELEVPQTRILFSFLGTGDEGLPQAGRYDRAFRALMRLAGEPFRFSIRRDELSQVCREQGLQLTHQFDDEALARRYLGPPPWPLPLLGWEYVARADRTP